MARIKDLIGRQFGLLTVIKFDGLDKTKKAKWLCECKCGKFVSVVSASLSYGSSKSCGCARLEKTKTMAQKYLLKHGKTAGGNSQIYRVWANMITRCTNPKSTYFKHYGGRGIKVSKDWEVFSNFYKDMSDCPQGKSLDRIDVNGDYCKENCRWATKKEQSNNTRRNRIVEFNSEKMTIAQASEKFGIKYKSLWAKLKSGKTLTEIVEKKRQQSLMMIL